MTTIKQELDATGLERLVLKALACSRNGLISDEVRALYPTLAYSSITARYSELLRKGLIRLTGKKRPGKSGRAQRVMVIAKDDEQFPS
jgi:hypothetical protein